MMMSWALLAACYDLTLSSPIIPSSPQAEIELDDDMYYHSVFACPVTREQARDGNPAMLLKCGHVICKESLEQLASGRSRYVNMLVVVKMRV